MSNDHGKLKSRFLRICQNRDYKNAISFQKEVRQFIPGIAFRGKITTICGFDISYDKKSNMIFGAAALFSYPQLELIKEATLFSEVSFPYIPGLLAFREGPAIMELLDHIKNSVDILIFEAHGMAHPRGAGLASVIGLILDKPSIGCAKTPLVGEFKAPAISKAATNELRFLNKVIGKVLRTRANVAPIFVSIGYKFSLKRSVDIVINCCQKYRIPEPIRHAHILANETRQKYHQMAS